MIILAFKLVVLLHVWLIQVFYLFIWEFLILFGKLIIEYYAETNSLGIIYITINANVFIFCILLASKLVYFSTCELIHLNTLMLVLNNTSNFERLCVCVFWNIYVHTWKFGNSCIICSITNWLNLSSMVCSILISAVLNLIQLLLHYLQHRYDVSISDVHVCAV